MKTAWCRSCGAPQPTQAGPCAACGVDLSVDAPPDWPIGLVYEARGTLGLLKKYGICVGFDGDSLLVHYGAKEKELTRIPRQTQPSAATPAQLSAATRLLYAVGQPPKGAQWNADWLRQQVSPLCQDIRALRRLYDESLTLGWQHILDWAPLSPSEKAWRTAHHAAGTGDVPRLRAALAQLPPQGYADRALLVTPHLAAVRADGEAWRPIAQTLVSSQADRGLEVLVAALGAPAKALENAVRLLPDAAVQTWQPVLDGFDSGRRLPPPPKAEGAASWLAASLISSDTETNLDARVAQVVGAGTALLDDLVDSGRLTAAAAFDSAGKARTYLQARLAPERLTPDELRMLGHLDEFARRCFLARDRATLFGLDPTPRVQHYQALLDVVEGAAPDPERLDAATLATLALPDQALAALKAGEARTLPPAVAADGSLWPLFSELAITGQLLPDASRAADHPLNTWIALKRLLGLLWEGRWSDAVDHGTQLMPHLTDERMRDEAANLTAFALDQLGRSQEALNLLKDALSGLYTENLLVNASLIAGKVSPDVGVRYLARLVDEAPTEDLQRAALWRALDLWSGSGEPFPQVLIPIIQRFLTHPVSVADYLSTADIAAVAVPAEMVHLPNPGGEFDGPYRIMTAAAKFRCQDNYLLSHLAEEYIAVQAKVGRPDWWNDRWKEWVDKVEDSVFVDFGEALGSAVFIDTVLVKAPALFTQRQRFVLAPQAGGHLAANAAKQQEWLSDQAFTKFLFGPVDEFLGARAQFSSDEAGYLARNMSICLLQAGFRSLGAMRDSYADRYNTLGARMRVDSENRFSLLVQQQEVLERIKAGPLVLLDGCVHRLRRLGSPEKEEGTRDLAKSVAEWRSEVDRLSRN